MHITDFKELRVWELSIQLVEDLYQLLGQFPNYETHALSSQMRRAAVSISSNIAEGCGRETLKDFIHFLYYSRGSLQELENQIIISKRLKYIADDQFEMFVSKIDYTRRMLNKLITFYKTKL